FQIWCYARIVELQSSAFIVHNEVLGEATFPLKFADFELRVGDKLEALYYKVRRTENRTHWMVQNAKLARPVETSEDKEEDKLSRNGDVMTKAMDIGLISPETNKSNKDRRVLDKMHHLLTFPGVMKTMLKEDPKSHELIMRILEKDASR
ncbi:hypothetical protein PMAYCL1PPCAC_19723, partial [Pristionchus mayeri]